MSDEIANLINFWDNDDELSRNEEDAVAQLSSSISPAAWSAFIARKSSDEDKSDDESTGTTSA